MKANLHVHTKYSDGSLEIKDLPEYFQKHDFQYIAITDHDTVNSYKEIMNSDYKDRIILGVEMSVRYSNENIHILGYFKDEVSDEIINFFQIENMKMEDRIKKIIENLKKIYGIEINYDEVRDLADGVINSSHVALAICNKYGYGFQEVYDKFLGKDKGCYVSSECISLEDGIKLLKKNNALVVLAHPVLIKKFDYHEILDKGFDGIEVFHPDQDDLYRENLLKEALEYNLLVTGGSDYHGDILPFRFDEAYLEGKYVYQFINRLKEK